MNISIGVPNKMVGVYIKYEQILYWTSRIKKRLCRMDLSPISWPQIIHFVINVVCILTAANLTMTSLFVPLSLGPPSAAVWRCGCHEDVWQSQSQCQFTYFPPEQKILWEIKKTGNMQQERRAATECAFPLLLNRNNTMMQECSTSSNNRITPKWNAVDKINVSFHVVIVNVMYF